VLIIIVINIILRQLIDVNWLNNLGLCVLGYAAMLKGDIKICQMMYEKKVYKVWKKKLSMLINVTDANMISYSSSNFMYISH